VRLQQDVHFRRRSKAKPFRQAWTDVSRVFEVPKESRGSEYPAVEQVTWETVLTGCHYESGVLLKLMRDQHLREVTSGAASSTAAPWPQRICTARRTGSYRKNMKERMSVFSPCLHLDAARSVGETIAAPTINTVSPLTPAKARPEDAYNTKGCMGPDGALTFGIVARLR